MIHPSTPDIIRYLNEMLEADRDAISELFAQRVPALSLELFVHPTVQLLLQNGEPTLGVLGLLNGFCGAYDADEVPEDFVGYGPITADWIGDTIQQFRLTHPPREE